MPGIADVARTRSDSAAIVTPRSTLTYGDLDARQRLLAGALRVAGLRAGDRIAVMAANRPELLEVTIGALRARLVPVPVHATLTPAEAAYVVEDSAARWIFADRPAPAPVGVERVVTFGDAYERLLHEANESALAAYPLGPPMHYTSGTTGRPKGVWVEFSDERTAGRASTAFRGLWGMDAGTIHLVCSPLTHSAPHRFASRVLDAGGTVIVQSGFDAAEALAATELFGVTSTFVVPTHIERIVALGPRVLARHDLSSLRVVAHAGAPIRPKTKRAAIDLFPEDSVWEFYGATEGQATRVSTPDWLKRPGTVGRPLPGVAIEILGDSGMPLGPGEVGEVWIRDPHAQPFRYWGDPEATRSARRGDAFTAGDLGWLDGDGYLFLAGRRHDMIITGGVNVYPQEVEAALAAHEAVREAMVYGVPHDEWGQEVRALVVCERRIDVTELSAWLRSRLAGPKRPKQIAAVDELPRTPTGKLLRRAPEG